PADRSRTARTPGRQVRSASSIVSRSLLRPWRPWRSWRFRFDACLPARAEALLVAALVGVAQRAPDDAAQRAVAAAAFDEVDHCGLRTARAPDDVRRVHQLIMRLREPGMHPSALPVSARTMRP